VPFVRCPVQRRSLLVASSCEVGTTADEQPHDAAVAPEGSHVQWGAVTVAAGINSSTARDKQAGYLHVVVACSKMKGSATATVASVDASAAAY